MRDQDLSCTIHLPSLVNTCPVVFVSVLTHTHTHTHTRTYVADKRPIHANVGVTKKVSH